ncbi:MAG: contact-dependent growth inhibition system immunity protein [Enterobacter hormaechei]
MLKELAEEVDCFLKLYEDRLDEQFKSRYGFDFSPELWDSTPFDFLMTVRRLALSSK